MKHCKKGILAAFIATLLLFFGCSTVSDTTEDQSSLELETDENIEEENYDQEDDWESTFNAYNQMKEEEEDIVSDNISSQNEMSEENQNANKTIEVWIPQSGSKYHKNSDCSNMKNPTKVSRNEISLLEISSSKSAQNPLYCWIF